MRFLFTLVTGALLGSGISMAAEARVPLAAGPASDAVSRDQADAILSELRQIRMLLERGAGAAQAPSPREPQMPQPVANAAIALGSEFVLGSKNAPVTIIEFSDYQCGFCRRFHTEAFAQIRAKYIDTGRVRFVSRDMPLDASGPSLRAAEAVRCAGEQDRYWELRDSIIAGPPRLSNESIRAHAGTIVGLDLAKFDSCVSSGKHAPAIQKDIEQAADLKIGGTPSFVIGRSTAEGVDGTTLVGALGFAVFEAKILEGEKK